MSDSSLNLCILRWLRDDAISFSSFHFATIVHTMFCTSYHRAHQRFYFFFANVDVVAVVVIVDVAFCCYAFCTFLKFNVLCKSVQHNNRTVQSSFTIDFTYPLFYSNNILSFIHALNGLEAWFGKI